MNEPSEEQKRIIEKIKEGKNVSVDACAGSGKSTTILSTAKQIAEKHILQITFNSMLRKEIKEKIEEQRLKNIHVHTFHSLAYKYYLEGTHSDTELRKILSLDLSPRTTIPIIDILVLDEAQDMTALYFQLILKYIRDMLEGSVDRKIQIFILGDYKQGLYEFLGSDIRFLTMAEEIWKDCIYLSTPAFEKCELKTSYRITQQMADFVNISMLGENRLLSVKSGVPVSYIRRSPHDSSKIIYNKILQLIDRGHAKPQDFFILSSSVKTKNIRKLENILTEKGIPCYVPPIERDEMDERVIQGKVVFSTFHSTKGRQRKYVFVVGFDNSYFIGKTIPANECPNTLYVACTRATTGLYLIENCNTNDKPLKFLRMTHYDMIQSSFVDFNGIPQTIFYKDVEFGLEMTEKVIHTTPTKMIQFLNENAMEIITPLLEKVFRTISVGDGAIEIPSIIETQLGYYEDVSELNGICIPAIYYDRVEAKWEHDGAKQSVLMDVIKKQIAELKSNEHVYLRNTIEELGTLDGMTEIGTYLYLSNIYMAIKEGLYYKLKLISLEEYNWISNEDMKKCIDRIDSIVKGDTETMMKPEFEKTIINYEMDYTSIDTFFNKHKIPYKFRFNARIDMITEDSVYELKMVSALSTEHLLQLVIYAWLWKWIYPEDKKRFQIVNIKTGEIQELDTEMETEINKIVITILKSKYFKNENKTDEDFLEECESYLQRWE